MEITLTNKSEKKDVATKTVELNSSYQHSLFRLKAQDIYNSNLGTADLTMIVTASNNRDYAAKSVNDGNSYIPATEIFCYEMARELNIATPDYEIIELPNNELVFGSAWEGGIIEDTNMVADILNKKTSVRGLERFFSKVYALDLFINNIDRHFGNYIFRATYNGTIALAFDFSRAWYAFSAYGQESKDDDTCRTSTCIKIIRQTNNFNTSIALSTLDEIGSISKTQISQILQSIPTEWFSDTVRIELLNWWGSQDMNNRLIQLKASI